MSVGFSLTFFGKGIELYAGGGSGKWKLLSISLVVLTVGIEFSVKV